MVRSSLLLLEMVALCVATSGCLTEADCAERIVQAASLAVEDAAACRYDATVVPLPYCAGDDARPLLRYQLEWCVLAEPTCIDAQFETYEVCYGDPPTRSIARVRATGRDGDWVRVDDAVVTSADRLTEGRETAGFTVQPAASSVTPRGLHVQLNVGVDLPSRDERVSVVGRVAIDEAGDLRLIDASFTSLGTGLALRPLLVASTALATADYDGVLVVSEGLTLGAEGTCPDGDCLGETLWQTDAGVLLSDRAFVGETQLDAAVSAGSGTVAGVVYDREGVRTLLVRDIADLESL